MQKDTAKHFQSPKWFFIEGPEQEVNNLLQK